MSGAVRFLRPRRDSDRHGRNLHCTRCGDLVRVYEIPVRWINPATYQCGLCGLASTMKEPPVPFHEQHRKDAA